VNLDAPSAAMRRKHGGFALRFGLSQCEQLLRYDIAAVVPRQISRNDGSCNRICKSSTEDAFVRAPREERRGPELPARALQRAALVARRDR
jgi:hypothetical protein